MSAAPHRLRTGLSRLPQRIATLAGLASARFPVAVLLIVLFAVLANLEAADRQFWPDLPRLLTALAGAAAASVACRLGVEASRRGRVLPFLALPAVAAAVAGATLFFHEPLSLHAPALLPALVFAIPIVPFVARGTAEAFWTFTLWTAVGVALAFVSVIVFAFGLLAILEMVRFLFDVGPGHRAYRHILVTAVTLVGPLFALGRIPALGPQGPAFPRDDRLVAAVRPLFDWVAAPLALATALVLHLYALRILVTGEWPVGQIGWIVTSVLILFLGLRVAIDPFLDGGAWTARTFGRLWAPLLIVPLGLLGTAAALRIVGEGWTIERYFLVLGGVAGALSILVQLVPRLCGDIRTLAAIPTLLLMLSVAGPWSAAVTVGRSQASRITADFVERSGGVLDVSRLDGAERRTVRTRVAELGKVRQLRRLAAFVPEDRDEARRLALDANGEDRAPAFLDALGLRDIRAETQRGFAAIPAELAITGYDIAFLSQSVWRGAAGGPATPDLRLRFDRSELIVDYRGGTDRVDLSGWIAGLPAATFEPARSVEPIVLDVRSAGGRRLRLRFEQLTLDGELQPISAAVTVLLIEADWPSLGGG